MVFSKIYKAAVDECPVNEKLKQQLILEAEKSTKEKHKNTPLYRYSLAAAVVLLVISVKNVPDIVQILNPVKHEEAVIESILEEKVCETEDMQNIQEKGIQNKENDIQSSAADVGETHKQSADKSNFSSDIYVKAKPTQQITSNADEKKSSENKKLKQNKKVQTDKPQNMEKNIENETDELIVSTAESESLSMSSEALEAKEKKESNDEAEIAEGDYEKNEKRAAGGSGGGVSSASAAVMLTEAEVTENTNQKLWDLQKYCEYLGFNIMTKLQIPDGFKDETVAQRYFECDDKGNPLNDEWTYSFVNGDKSFDVITSRNVKKCTGERQIINNTELVINENVYLFCCGGISIRIISSNVERETIIEVIKSITK